MLFIVRSWSLLRNRRRKRSSVWHNSRPTRGFMGDSSDNRKAVGKAKAVAAGDRAQDRAKSNDPNPCRTTMFVTVD